MVAMEATAEPGGSQPLAISTQIQPKDSGNVPLSAGERIGVRAERPSANHAAAEATGDHATGSSNETRAPEFVLREPQDDRGDIQPDQHEQYCKVESASTPVSRPLTLFDIPIFAIDPLLAEARTNTDEEAAACSLETPENCEACQ